MAPTAAVFFDVDFTLIHPGPRFQGAGYQASCRRHGLDVDASRFDAAVAGAAAVLESADEVYDADLYVKYTRRIIELMGGNAPAADLVARQLYDEWAEHQHFSLYDDVLDTLHELRTLGVRTGLISNSHRCLDSFRSHFALEGLLDVVVSSSDHGYMKPHPNIFWAALRLMDVAPEAAMMVGDSVGHDVEGARRAGMRGVLLARDGRRPATTDAIDVIASLRELPSLVTAWTGQLPASRLQTF